MKTEPYLAPLRNRATRLESQCAPLAGNPLISRAMVRLRQLADTPEPTARPALVALVGGSGAGKSTLFNSLLQLPDASSTSDTVRRHTKVPVVARVAAEHHLLPTGLLNEPGIKTVDSKTPKLAFADTPDIDGCGDENRAVTMRVLRDADIVVYVASHEKFANHDILSVVREWALQKRWLFVLNKFELEKGDPERLKQEFQDSLSKKLGFDCEPKDVYFTNALDWAHADVSRLRNAIFRERSSEVVAALTIDAVAAQVHHACAGGMLENIRQLADELDEYRKSLSQQLLDRLVESVKVNQLDEKLVPLFRTQIWEHVPSAASGPIAIPVLIHARITTLVSAVQVWRMASTGFSFWRIGTLVSTMYRALRGTIELKGVLANLEGELRPVLNEIQDRARERLDEHGFDVESPDSDATTGEEVEAALREFPVLGRPLAKLGNIAWRVPEGARLAQRLAPALSSVIQMRATRAAHSSVNWLARASNILPWLVILHSSFLLLTNWLSGTWLPGSFYLHAAALFFLSLLPGYLMLRASVEKLARSIDSASMLSETPDRMALTAELATALKISGRLRMIHTDLVQLDRQATNLRDSISSEFGLEGSTLQSQTNTPSH